MQDSGVVHDQRTSSLRARAILEFRSLPADLRVARPRKPQLISEQVPLAIAFSRGGQGRLFRNRVQETHRIGHQDNRAEAREGHHRLHGVVQNLARRHRHGTAPQAGDDSKLLALGGRVRRAEGEGSARPRQRRGAARRGEGEGGEECARHLCKSRSPREALLPKKLTVISKPTVLGRRSLDMGVIGRDRCIRKGRRLLNLEGVIRPTD